MLHGSVTLGGLPRAQSCPEERFDQDERRFIDSPFEGSLHVSSSGRTSRNDKMTPGKLIQRGEEHKYFATNDLDLASSSDVSRLVSKRNILMRDEQPGRLAFSHKSCPYKCVLLFIFFIYYYFLLFTFFSRNGDSVNS